MIDAAVVGCGRMGAFTSEAVRKFAPACWFPLAHAEAMSAHEAVSLVALCDPSKEALAKAAERFAVERGYAGHSEMLVELVPALVGIATRTIGRAQTVADFAQAGTRAFHVEKPLCNSVAELDQIESLFADGESFLTLGAVRRHFAPYRQALRLASSGEHGRMIEARVAMGMAPLYWTHPHSVDLICFAAGNREVEAVSAHLSGVEARGATIATDPIILAATIFFDDGFTGHIGRAPGADFHISCENAEYSVLNDGARLKVAKPVGDDPYRVHETLNLDGADAHGGTLAAIDQLVGCLSGEDEAIATNAILRRDIFRAQRIMFAMVQSHLEGGRPVSLANVDPAMVIEGRTGQYYA